MNASEVGAVLDQMHAEQHAKYYMAECPNCRRANKVSLKQLRRYAPRDWSPTPAEKHPAAAEKEGKAEKEAAPKEKEASASKAKSTTKSTTKKTSTSKSKSKSKASK
jgi:cytochrome c1